MEDVRWQMLVAIPQMRRVYIRWSWRISTDTTRQTEHHLDSSIIPPGNYFACSSSVLRFLFSRFTTPHHKEGFELFLDTVTEMEDVWLVTSWQAVQWMRDPTPLDKIMEFKPFQCDYKVSRAGYLIVLSYVFISDTSSKVRQSQSL